MDIVTQFDWRVITLLGCVLGVLLSICGIVLSLIARRQLRRYGDYVVMDGKTLLDRERNHEDSTL